MLNVFLFYNFFEKKRKCVRLFWGHIDNFFRERRRLASKINITFLSQIRYLLNILLFSSFFKKAVFSEKTIDKTCMVMSQKNVHCFSSPIVQNSHTIFPQNFNILTICKISLQFPQSFFKIFLKQSYKNSWSFL